MHVFKYLGRYYLSIAMAVIIMILSLLPVNPSPGNDLFDIPYIDKYVHFMMYFFLCLFMLYEFSKNNSHTIPNFLKVIVLSSVYGGFIEILQLSMVERSGELLDFAADICGSLMAIPAFLIYYKNIKAKKKRYNLNQN